MGTEVKVQFSLSETELLQLYTLRRKLMQEAFDQANNPQGALGVAIECVNVAMAIHTFMNTYPPTLSQRADGTTHIG